ncbi:T9SS type A sorting domain-containing protein [Flavivirga amylovorans]|uniref:T9SS type A sorting domain-containing protein n=1 Tax=Flavivirga amylovorans TaxID=870486 RepID=A0ABT8X5L9_9FLAO|nr:T9SS type A sorting domain-containing protein [Flavivirga amylovorans]MDO5989252.1 T9SS type A sorting domain-containing protein [Flavivirga amylovorans]
MKKNLFLVFFIPLLSISQIQIDNDIDGEADDDQFGYSVSLSGDGSIMAISAPKSNDNGNNSGHVKIYENAPSGWTQIGDKIEGQELEDQFGYSISLSNDGSIVAIGSPYNNGVSGIDFGQVQIYKYNELLDTWEKVGNDIKGKAAGNLFGHSVSLSNDGSKVVVGATNFSAVNISYVQVYEYNESSSTWEKLGDDIYGETAGNGAGYSVSFSGNGAAIAVGAPRNDFNGGHVIVYEYNSSFGEWIKMGDNIDGEDRGDQSGYSVSLSDDGLTVAIGSPTNSDLLVTSGHVRVFKYISNSWQQLGSDIDGEAASNQSGTSVSLSGDGTIVAIGSPQSNLASGHVRVFKYNVSSKDWIKIGANIDGEDIADLSGSSVSLSSNNGSKVAIGAPKNLNATNSGHVRVYNLRPVLSSNSFVLSRFRISPNPATFQTTIKLNKGLILEKISIYNGLGQFIKSTQKSIIDTSDLSSGMYYLQIVTDKGNATKKLIIE